MINEKNKLKFTIIWSSCLCLLLLLVGLGINFSVKGTSAATYKCPDSAPNEIDGKCCPSSADKIVYGYCVSSSLNPIYNTLHGYVCEYTKSTDNVDDFTCEGGYSKTCTSKDGSTTAGTCTCYKAISSCGVKPSEKSDASVDEEKCYECNGQSGLLYWGTSTSGAPSCGGEWHERSDLDKNSCKASLPTYTISYNANGGTSAPNSQTKTHDVDLTLKGSATHSESCYKFSGWAYGGNKNTVVFVPGDKYTSNSPATLYAVWDSSPCNNNNDPTPPTGNTGNTNPPSNEPTTPSSSSQPTSSEPDDDNSNVEPLPESSSNVDENPPTGEITIFIVWVVAAMAIVYSIWYFKQVREN